MSPFLASRSEQTDSHSYTELMLGLTAGGMGALDEVDEMITMRILASTRSL